MRRVMMWMIFVLGNIITICAQNKVVSITGKVIESDSKEAAEMVNVQILHLPDSTYVVGNVTNKQGSFVLSKVTPGKYLLRISSIGFKTKNIPLTLLASAATRNVGTVSLEPDAVMLNEAVVVGQAPPVVVKADTTEYSAAAYPVPEGSMLEDLVKKIPGAKVDENGKITLNGKEIKKIMVDGKEFFSNDPKMSMKNLPASMIDKVKAYDKKSDMSRITGIDDGEEEPVLDLSVKKGMKQGWIGNLIAGYGSQDRYEGGAMVSRFKDDSSISIIGSLNNTNNKGFSEFGDAGQGMGGNAGAGITKAQSIGVNFAKETQKIQVGGNVQYGHSDNHAVSRTETEMFLGNNQSTFSNSTNTSNRERHDVRADLRLEWRPDTLTTVIFRPSGNYSRTNANGSSASQTEDNNHSLINNKLSSSNSKSNNFSLDGNLMAFRRLNNKGRNLFVGARFGYSDSGSDSYSFSDMTFKKTQRDSVSVISRYIDKNSDSRNWSASASYTEPIFKNHFLQLRYEFSHRKQTSQSLVYNIEDMLPYISDYALNKELFYNFKESLSSEIENFYDTHSINMSLRGITPKMMYSAGFTATPQSSLSKVTLGPNSKNSLPQQNVLNWAPSAMFRYMFSKQNVLMFRYRGRSNTPSIDDLQEVIDVTDPMNLKYGNPDLKPSFNNSLMVYYNKFDSGSMRSYSANLFYSNTINSVVNRVVYNPDTGGKISYKENINGNWDTRGYFSFNTPLKNNKFTISSNTNMGYNHGVSYTSVGGNKATDQVLSTTNNLTAGERLTGAYRSEVFDFSINGGIDYSYVRNNKQTSSNRETYDYYVGANTIVNLPWDVSVSSDVNCRFKDGYSQGLNNNEILWNAQLSKNFLRGKVATIRFKMYDILKQQTNLSRTISETMMSDTEYNTLGSYFMVHFVYRFNTLGGRKGGPSFNSDKPHRGSGGGHGFGHMMY